MGLSGRRRAKKETRNTTSTSTGPTGDLINTNSHIKLRGNARKRTGNTYRRAFGSIARDYKHTNLLEFDVARGWSNALLPPKQQTHPDIGASTNANLWNRKMIRILNNDYTSNLLYSVNKHNRWGLIKQLTNQYDTPDAEELKKQNFFLVESKAKGTGNGSTQKLTTNALYITDAATELYAHKAELKAKCSQQPKQRVMQNDRFQFSERITQRQTERPLNTINAVSPGGSINIKSVRRSCNLWSHLYNVSPSAEEARMSMQRDYETRMEVFVGTCVSCENVDIKRCFQAEKAIREEKRNEKISKDFPYGNARRIERQVQKKRRNKFELQLEMDGTDGTEELEIYQEAAAETVELDESLTSCRHRDVTLFDAMRPATNFSANRAKKQAIKAMKAMKAMKSEKQEKKQRNNTDQTAGSSGYGSGCEDGEVSDVQKAETEVVDARLSEAVEVAIEMARPIVMVPHEFADETRITKLFAGCFEGAERTLTFGNSLPRKLAILLRPDVSETVVFEEVTAHNPALTAFTVHHICCDQVAKTSAQEVASQADPFEFLRSLIPDSSDATKKTVKAEVVHGAEVSAAGWRRANVLTETDARLMAIRALPMFSATGGTDVDTELVPSAECEICYQQLSLEIVSNESQSFAEGSTMLMECGHRFCNRCWLQHVASSVARGRADVSCPGFKCQAHLDAATLLWFCPGDLLSALTAAAFRSWLTERQQRRQRRYCPHSNCGHLLESTDCVNTSCGFCNRGLCLRCGQEPHWPSNCVTAAKYRNKMEALGHVKLLLRDLKAEINVNAKPCPSCHLIMEKGFGCNHMTCPCGENFCWWCGQSMQTHNGGPCNNGSTGKGKSGYLVQRVFTAKDSVLVPNSSQSRMYCEAVKIRLVRESTRVCNGAIGYKITELFVSYAIRFQDSVRGNFHDANRLAKQTTRQFKDAITQASYLVEYSYANLDNYRGHKWTKYAVRAIGSQISQLVKTITSEIVDQYRKGYQGPKRIKIGCERLLMMLGCLKSRCRLLHGLVAKQGSSGRLVASAVQK